MVIDVGFGSNVRQSLQGEARVRPLCFYPVKIRTSLCGYAGERDTESMNR
jgi:hypothetical protein